MKFSSAEQYLEKLAAIPLGQGNASMGELTLGIKPALKFLLESFKHNPEIAYPLAIGGGVLGAGGLFKMLGGERPGDTFSYRINKNLNGLLDRIRYDEVAGDSFAKEMGSESAKALMGLATDMAAKTVDTVKSVAYESPVRSMIFNTLRKEDPIIGQADMKTLNDAFHTMSNVAPSLSTDKNAVKSVLRLAATSGGGLDYQTIKGLADAETSLKKARGEMR